MGRRQSSGDCRGVSLRPWPKSGPQEPKVVSLYHNGKSDEEKKVKYRAQIVSLLAEKGALMSI
jgi:hypothetical protein